MLNSLNIQPGKGKYLFGLLLLIFTGVICVAFNNRDDDFDIARKEVLLRKVGHEILLQSGDSTSRVLPVKKIAENEYRITFEHDFTFKTDSLVSITQRLLDQDPLTNDYVVNVLNCGKSDVFYAFAIAKSEKGSKKSNIVACQHRIQPKACYVINIKFRPTGTATNYLLGGLPLLAFVGFFVLRSIKPRKTLPKVEPGNNTFALGAIVFDAGERKLKANETITELTGTETRLLLIFAAAPNQIIARSRLQKEIWEDEGVIVGRSLDMFISKLRKKLELDPAIKIVVIRGKGYKLELNA